LRISHYPQAFFEDVLEGLGHLAEQLGNERISEFDELWLEPRQLTARIYQMWREKFKYVRLKHIFI
jgi:hypothetical protein